MSSLLLLCLVATTLVVVQAQRVPKVKWGQSADRITFSILSTKCVQNDKKSQEFTFSIKEDDRFSFACQGETGAVSLNFTLREDVIGSLSNCVSDYPKHTDIKCTLRKKHQHTFDRLVDDLANLPPGTVIRERATGTDANLPPPSEQGETDDYWKSNPEIKEIDTPADYTRLLKQEFTLVDVSYPWCSQCATAKGKFMELLNLIQKSQHTLNNTLNFAYVDARHHRQARKYFNPVCEASCDLFVVRRRERPYRIPYQYEIERVMFQIFNYDKERVYEVGNGPDDLVNYTKAHHCAAIATFPTRGDYRAEVFNRVVNLVRGRNLALGVRFDPAVPKATLTMIRNHKFDGDVEYDGVWEVEAVMKFLNHSVVPNYQEYEYEMREDADATGKPHTIFFSPNGEPKHIFAEIREKFRGKTNFFYVNTSHGNYGNMMEEYGFGHEDTVNPHIAVTPRFAGKDASGKDQIKHGFTDGHITEDNKGHVMAWLTQALGKSLNRTYKSAKKVGEFYVGDLNTIVGKTVEEYRNETTFHTIALFYKFHQDNTEEIRNDMRRMARMLRKNNVEQMFLASMETVRNTFNVGLFCDLEEEHANPVILLLGSGKCFKFTMRRNDGVDIPMLLAFAKKYVPCIRNAWGKMQEEIDEIRAKEAAEQKAIEEKKKEFEDALDTYEKVKLAKGVVKYIKVRGEAGGSSPYEGSDVTCHFALYLHSTVKKIESSYTNGQIFRFKMGAGGVVKCFDEAFASMVPGEKSVLFCPSDMAYNTYGTTKVPVNADLYYEIHLISFDEKNPEL